MCFHIPCNNKKMETSTAWVKREKTKFSGCRALRQYGKLWQLPIVYWFSHSNTFLTRYSNCLFIFCCCCCCFCFFPKFSWAIFMIVQCSFHRQLENNNQFFVYVRWSKFNLIIKWSFAKKKKKKKTCFQ